MEIFFVTRIAGNIASSENVGSLEFGTLVLGAKVLFVLGHSNGGAVAATIKSDEVPGQISGLFQHIRPVAKEANGDIAKAVEVNVRNQAMTLAESSPVIARLVREKKLVIAGGVYLGSLAGLDAGSCTVLGTMAASASYIAAPPAVRMTLPEANPTFYLTAALAITFPFNLLVGIPLYFRMALAITGHVSP